MHISRATFTGRCTTFPHILHPAGATAHIWQDVTPQAFRVIHGSSRGLSGRHDVIIGTSAIHFAHGTADDGSTLEARASTWRLTTQLTPAEATQLIAVITECINEVEGLGCAMTVNLTTSQAAERPKKSPNAQGVA